MRLAETRYDNSETGCSARLAYLALYNVFYMFDDALILAIAIVTLSHHRLQRNEARGLKLLSGVVMVALGVVLIVQPSWLVG